MTSPKQKVTRPIFLGNFQRNDRQNVILTKDVCDRLGIDSDHTLALYMTPEGQIVGRVIESKVVYEGVEPYMDNDGNLREGLRRVFDVSWLYDGKYMPTGFLAPEDTRW